MCCVSNHSIFLLVPPPDSLALNRFKEFLESNLLYGMYGDALASGNLDFATSEQPKSFAKLQSFLQAPVHISRVDAFTLVQLALGSAVCRYVRSLLDMGLDSNLYAAL